MNLPQLVRELDVVGVVDGGPQLDDVALVHLIARPLRSLKTSSRRRRSIGRLIVRFRKNIFGH